MKRNIKFVLTGLLLCLVSLRACSLSGSAVDGVVLDQNTGKPVAGAIVIVRWLGDAPAGPGSSTNCYHVETAITNSSGKYHASSWSRFSFKGIFVSQRAPIAQAFKPGYTKSTPQAFQNEPLKLSSFIGSKSEYFGNLLKIPNCPGGAESQRNLYYVYKILVDEAELLAETPEQHEKVSLLRRLTDETLVDRSKPTEFVGGFTRNLNKNDNYKLDELEK